jgi:hypothetical protein
MLMDTCSEIAGYAGVKYRIPLIGQNIDPIDLFHIAPSHLIQSGRLLRFARNDNRTVIARSAATKQSRPDVRGGPRLLRFARNDSVGDHVIFL